MLSSYCQSRVVMRRAASLLAGAPRNGDRCKSYVCRRFSEQVHVVSGKRTIATESRALVDLAKEDQDSFGTLSPGRRQAPRERNLLPRTGLTRTVEPMQLISREKLADKTTDQPALSPADNFTTTAIQELDGDKDDSVFDSPPAAHPETRKPLSYYVVQIRSFIKKKMLKEAIDVLEVKMLKRDGRKPDEKIYDMLIQACGKLGYTKKAFELFNDMKARGLKPPNCMYTALFNACTNSPFKEDGLERAHRLYDAMIGSGRHLNTTQYECAIKAFGRCGDFETALKLMDSMVREEHTITAGCFNALLHGCVEDRQNGFRDAMLVWRKMRVNGIRPSVQTYNLLLRAVRDCGAGESPNAGQELLESITGREAAIPKQLAKVAKVPKGRKSLPSSSSVTKVSVDPLATDPNVQVTTGKMDLVAELERHGRALMDSLSLTEANAPAVPLDLLGKSLVARESLHDIVSVNQLDRSEDRLMLLGGAPTILLHMRADGLRPNVKTFSQILSSLPRNDESEKFLVDLLKMHGVKPDTDFFNQLIKRQCLRGYFIGARNTLRLMSAEAACQPDIMTFGVLALGCCTEERQNDLLRDMEAMGFELNVEITGAFVRETLRAVDYPRAVALMKLMDEKRILADPGIVQLFEKLRKRALVDRLLGEDHVPASHVIDASKVAKSDALERKKNAIAFLGAYKAWIKRSRIDLPQHPWRHFEVGNPPKTEVVEAIDG